MYFIISNDSRAYHLCFRSFSAMEKAYNELFTVGDHLVVELHCRDIFEGDFVQGALNRIDVSNTKQWNNPNPVLGHMYSFYRTEIRNIYKFNNEDRSVAISHDSKVIDLTENEFKQLQFLIDNVTYLDNVDKRYYDAVELLSKAEVIGVAALGVVQDQSSLLKILAVSTWKHVYLFDLINIQRKQLHKELRHILENKYICKVMHKAGTLTTILYQKYKVYVRNVFDTQVCDLLIRKNSGENLLNSTTKTLPECLNCYLNLPIFLLHEACMVKWENGHLSSQQKLFGAQVVSFLIFLKEKMEKVLYDKLFKSMEDVHSYYHNLDDSKLADAIASKDIPEEVRMLLS